MKIKYRTTSMSDGQTMLSVISDFYSDVYGVCVIGYNKEGLISKLADKLQRDYGIIGMLVRSDKDDADNIGKRSNPELSVERKSVDHIGRGRALLGVTLRQENDR